MSLNASALKLMADKGLSAHDIAEIAAANEVRRDPGAADRMAKMRANRKGRVTRNVTANPPIEEDHTPEASEDKSSSPHTAPFVLPADIPAEPFSGFVAMRKQIKKPMNDRAKHLAVLRLRKLRDEDGWPPGDVLNHCTLNSYQGLFPPKDRNNGISQQQQPRQTNPTLDILRAANEAIARSEAGQDHCGTWPALPSANTG